MVLTFQETKLLPSKIGGMIDPYFSWLLMMMDLPSSDQASSEGPALIPIVENNTERGVNQYYLVLLTNLPYLHFELFLHISTIK